MESAYMAFFINRLALKAKPLPIHESLSLTTAEMREVEELWFEDAIPSCKRIDTHDVQNLLEH